MARILVLDGHSSASLAFVRSLGRGGHWVAVGCSERSFAPASLSRYCRERLEYPAPGRSAVDFVQAIAKLGLHHKIDAILPMTDATVWPLARYRDLIQSPVQLIVSDVAAIEMVSDKYRTVELARKLGVSVPETILVRSAADLRPASGWSFPVVVKDRFSLRWIADKSKSGSVSYAYSQDELHRLVERRLNEVGEVMVQQYTAGLGVGFSCFALQGECYLPFQWVRLREKDPRGSGSSARKSVSLESRVARSGFDLVAGAGFKGLSMVEFKMHPQTGNLTLMEINGRPWGSMQLPICCGIDYPLHLIRWHLEGTVPPRQIQYKVGINCRDFVSDLTHLENVWNGKPPGWPIPYPSFPLTLLKVAIPWYPGLRYDDLSLSDLRPGLAGLGKWFSSHFGGKT